ncbi:hypothetical protein ACWD4L_41685 [Streptomyces sp. NPDC002596]
MDSEPPLVREVFPDLADESVALLEDDEERHLAICACDLRLFAECRCTDDFFQSSSTGPRRKREPYGEGHRAVMLSPPEGMLLLDAVHARARYVEVLRRSPMRDRRRTP